MTLPATDSRPRWSSEALHDQRRRLVKALPADCRESGSRGSNLSVGAKRNEQTFLCVQSNIHDPCGNTCRRSDHADRNITDSDDRLWCQEHTVHYDRDRARPHLDSEDGAIGGEYHAVGNYSKDLCARDRICRAVQVRTIEGVAENQECESSGSNTRNRGNVLIQL
jgi:hypothetical protein